MTFGQERGQDPARGILGSYIGTGQKSGVNICLDNVPTPRGQFDAIFQDLVALNHRLNEANAKMTTELIRIGGAWPMTGVGITGGPEGDDLISMIRRVVDSLSRDVAVFEDSIHRLGDL